jgi:hypothetical protein
MCRIREEKKERRSGTHAGTGTMKKEGSDLLFFPVVPVPVCVSVPDPDFLRVMQGSYR